MKRNKRSERGQALILIVFAIIGLIGMTALAVDGGNVYAERRRAQNAADGSALASALAYVRNNDLYTAGLNLAATNNYNDTDPGANSSSSVVNIQINHPPLDLLDTNSTYVGNSDYIQVIITAEVRTYFGRIVGINTVTNTVMAVAHAKPAVFSPIGFGNAIVSLSPDDCQAVTYQGNADGLLTGGGIFVNSNCDANGNQKAFFSQSSSSTLTTPCISVVGGIALNDPSKIHYDPPNPNCPESGASSLTGITYPNPICTSNGTNTAVAGGRSLTAGTFSGEFPPVQGNPNQTITLNSGIYCVDEFKTNAQTTVVGQNVVIVVKGSGNSVTINGGAGINLTGPTEGPYAGLVMFVPEAYSCNFQVNGDATVNITGEILAPSCNVTLNGSGSTFALNSQVVGNQVHIEGNAGVSIHYQDNQNYDAPIPPQIELVQ